MFPHVVSGVPVEYVLSNLERVSSNVALITVWVMVDEWQGLLLHRCCPAILSAGTIQEVVGKHLRFSFVFGSAEGSVQSMLKPYFGVGLPSSLTSIRGKALAKFLSGDRNRWQLFPFAISRR